MNTTQIQLQLQLNNKFSNDDVTIYVTIWWWRSLRDSSDTIHGILKIGASSFDWAPLGRLFTWRRRQNTGSETSFYMKIGRWITNSMDLSPREAASRSDIEEVHIILWNPKVHCRSHKSPPLVPILMQINPVHTAQSCLYKTRFKIVVPPRYKSS
jgi:hypothetical protein